MSVIKKEYYKYYIILLFRAFGRLFHLFPVKKDTVILTSFAGRRYSCNPKYLAEYLIKNSDYKIYFALHDDVDVKLMEGINRVKYGSLYHLFLLMTCQFRVENSSDYIKYMPSRKDQMYVYTQHGVALNKIGDDTYKKTKTGRKIRKLYSDNLNAQISNCEIEIDLVSQITGLDKSKILTLGFPRNDLFFKNNDALVKKVKDKLGINEQTKIILYAPTYRGDGEKLQNIFQYGFEILDTARVVDAFNKMNNCNHVLLYRAHHDMIPDNIDEACINVSTYPDMQELLLISDYLITDYSSTMWDFALQEKPGFMYTPDLDVYINTIPSIHPIDKWVYPYATTNEQLIKLIREYDECASVVRIREYFKSIGSKDDGRACERLFAEMEKFKGNIK